MSDDLLVKGIKLISKDKKVIIEITSIYNENRNNKKRFNYKVIKGLSLEEDPYRYFEVGDFKHNGWDYKNCIAANFYPYFETKLGLILYRQE